jgi:hypothetical protein
LLTRLFAVDQITNQHIQEDNIGRVDEGNILQTKIKFSLVSAVFFLASASRQYKQLESIFLLFILLAKAFISIAPNDAAFVNFPQIQSIKSAAVDSRTMFGEEIKTRKYEKNVKSRANNVNL